MARFGSGSSHWHGHRAPVPSAAHLPRAHVSGHAWLVTVAGATTGAFHVRSIARLGSASRCRCLCSCTHNATHIGVMISACLSLCSGGAVSIWDRGRCLSHARLSPLAVNGALSRWRGAPTRGTSCQAAAGLALRRTWSCRPLALLSLVK